MIEKHIKKLQNINHPQRGKAYNKAMLKRACGDSLQAITKLSSIFDEIGDTLTVRFKKEQTAGNELAMEIVDDISKDISNLILNKFNVSSNGVDLTALDELIKDI